MPIFNPAALTPAHIDVRFQDDPHFTLGDLGVGRLGVFAAAEPDLELIPRSEWKERCDKIQADNTGMENLITRIFNQQREGACVGHAGTQAMQIMMAQQFGKDAVIQLSPNSLYKQIGSSPSSGANVGDALEASSEIGLIPLDTAENKEKFGKLVMPEVGFRLPWPTGWKDLSKNFRVTEWWVLRKIDQIVTALLLGFPVVVGRNGHSICYVRAFFKGSALCVLYANSWRESWGVAAGDFEGGFGVDTEPTILRASSWAYCPRAIVVSDLLIAA